MNIMTRLFLIASCAAIFLFYSCKKSDKGIVDVTETTYQVPQNEWTMLSEGNSFDEWHGYNKSDIGAAWEIEEGVISFDRTRGAGGDIVTNDEYENFELSLEWKISECGNSGIFFNIVEAPEYPFPWLTGPEMQVLDNSCHPDAKFETHRAGCLYDLIEVAEENVKPAGEWNAISILSQEGDVTFTFNGVEVVQFTMHNEGWQEMIANSKFKDMPAFGQAKKGRIGLQDHTDPVWYRNVKIRTL